MKNNYKQSRILLNVVLLLFSTLFFGSLNAQQIAIETETYPSLTVCHDADFFFVSIINTTNSAVLNPQVKVELPTGIEYLIGTSNEKSSLNLQQSVVSDLQNPIFSANTIPVGDSLQFTISTKATAAAVNYLLQGNTFRNKVILTHNGGTETQNSNPYNLLYAALNIISVSPTSQALQSGESGTRTIQIVNAGYGKLANFFVTDSRGANLELIATDLGVLNATKDTIFLSGGDFSTIGNGDAFFDSNESITLTETIEASGCDNKTVSSVIKAHWGCENNFFSTSASNAHVSVSFKTPQLSVSTASSFEACFGSNEASQQEITITNTGQGIAKAVELDVFKSLGNNYDETIFSRIDVNSFKYQLNGASAQNIAVATSYTTRSDSKYACLGVNPIGRVVLNLPDLKAGESLVITWDLLHCNISACLNEKAMGWKYALEYTDGCFSQQYTKSDKGQETNNENMTLFTETPTDINHGATESFTYTISSYSNELPEGDGAHFEVVFTLPQGLVFNGDSSNLRFASESTIWDAFSFNYDAASRSVTAKYALPSPFIIPKSEITIDLVGDCSSSAGGSLNIELDINYVTDTTCTSNFSVPFICDYLIDVDLHCPPSGNCDGLTFLNYDIYRTSFGAPDNNQDGLADASGSINLNTVKTNRAMVGDTLEGLFTGTIGTTTNHPQWTYGYATTTIELGVNLDAINSKVRIYDASSSSYIICDQLPVTSQVNGTSKTFYFDFSTTALAASNASAAGFAFEQGDSVWLYSNYKVVGNIGGNVQEVKATNDYYVSTIANPTNNADKYQCGYYNDKFTLIGYQFSSNSRNYYSVTSCTRVISQNYRLSIGDCCSNFNGGNLFPYEYRNWGHVKTATVTIPANYTVVNSYTRQQRTKRTNSSVTQKVNSILPTTHQNNTLTYNLEQYYKPFGGTIDLSDDGFQGTLYLELAPNCFVPTNTYEDITWDFTFIKNSFIGGGETQPYTYAADKIRFTPTSLVLSSSNPIIDGLEKTVRWNVNVRNSTSKTDASNSWIHIKTPSNAIEIIKVIDESTGLEIPLTGDIYQIQTLDKNRSKDYTVVAKYGACNVDKIWVYSGYECSGYPTTFANFQCSYSQMELKVEPKPAGLQALINGNTIGGECSNTVEVTVEVASVKLANADSVKINFSLPSNNSITYINGSSEFKYALNNNFSSIADPIVNGKYEYHTVSYNVAISDFGLPGVLNLDSNKMQLKFQLNLEDSFKPGDFVLVSIEGQEVCGNKLQTIYMAYDPSIKFGKNETSGLSSDLNNNWSISWVDYNNDGWEDVFVTDYTNNKPNVLYQNNGDGTFSKALNAGSIVTDLGGSVSSTWADYDNDGDMDVFVSNNTGATNALYQNNGDETFTKKTSSILSQYGGYCHNASWADYDNDGHLDLFVSEYMPTRFNLLYHNNGDGTFSLTTNNPISQEAAYSIGATWGDYDNDGDLDLFVPNTNNQPNSLYKNDGDGKFTRILNGAIVTDANNSVGSSWGDYDNDGYLDLFVANSGNQNNCLYKNNQDGSFTKITTGAIVNSGGHSHGSSWADIDNDGDLDLLVTNDQDNANELYFNNNDGTFSEFESSISTDVANSFGAAWGDFDNDGDLDLLVANRGTQANDFYTNGKASCNTFACINLIGTNSNKSAIGAKIRIKATIYGNSFWQMKELSAQTGGGAGSQNSLKTIFGLGDAAAIDSVLIEWPSGVREYLTNVPVNNCIDIQEKQGSYVCGIVYYDENQNNVKDADEMGVANTQIKIMPGSIFTTTNRDGEYSVYLGNGNYTVSQVVPTNWTQISPVSPITYQLNIQTAGSTHCGIDFIDSPICFDPDLATSISATALRRGFRNTLLVEYSNTGSEDAINATLSITLDENIVPLSSTVPWDNVIGNTFYWNIDTIKPGEFKTIYLVDSVSRVAPIGDFINLQTAIAYNNNSQTGDCDLSNNQVTILEEVVGSVDPNDKLVFPRGYGPAGLITPEDTLTYRIRFQNVGNYMASIVIVVDTLSEYLDYSTFHDVELSHEGSYTLYENGVLKFEFYNIELPDSVSNEPQSHGFVEFKILPRKDCPEEAVILNKASIQFDYNDFIITNTVFNTVVSNVYTEKSLELLIYPNPTRTDAVAEIVSKNQQILPIQFKQIDIYTISGDLVNTYKLEDYKIVIRKDGLKPGIYIVKAIDMYGLSYTSKLVVLE